jgi:murein DD-endopeptidase MepM/ murein hydrolase activator NlpD
LGFLIPQRLQMPVVGATASDFNAASFWYYPWGKSVTHKGVDIFAKKGTTIRAATTGIVLAAGQAKRGGKFIVILGPKWRLHYYAHLETLIQEAWHLTNHDTKLGTVGTSGNAKGKPPHLHYAIVSLFPYVWCADSSIQGWKKMFYLNPITYLTQ